MEQHEPSSEESDSEKPQDEPQHAESQPMEVDGEDTSVDHLRQGVHEAEEEETLSEDGSEDGEDPEDVAMVPMADILNARYGCSNVSLIRHSSSGPRA